MDGLLLDTEAVYTRVLLAAAEANGVEMPLAFCHSMIGIPGKECDVLDQDFFGRPRSIRSARVSGLPWRATRGPMSPMIERPTLVACADDRSSTCKAAAYAPVRP